MILGSVAKRYARALLALAQEEGDPVAMADALERVAAVLAVPSVAECRDLFREYDRILVMRLSTKLDDPKDRAEWCRKKNARLLKLEREVFLSGYHKAFLLEMDECRICKECSAARIDCKKPKLARPSPEALAVDVFNTVRSLGFPIDVLSKYDQTMNRYAFLLVE